MSFFKKVNISCILKIEEDNAGWTVFVGGCSTMYITLLTLMPIKTWGSCVLRKTILSHLQKDTVWSH